MKKSRYPAFPSVCILLLLVVFLCRISTCSAFATPYHCRIASLRSQCQPSPTFKRSRRIKLSSDDDFDLKSIKIGDRDFWTQQKELAEEMAKREEKSLKEEQMKKYEQRAQSLVGDTLFFTLMIFPVLWLCFDNPFFSLSYVVGATFGLAYVYGLGKYVATLGGSIDDANAIQGAGVGEARFAFLILLFIFVGKFRSYGLVEIPCIAGFFTYQIASLGQGLKEIND